jgi:hypothetical protein
MKMHPLAQTTALALVFLCSLSGLRADSDRAQTTKPTRFMGTGSCSSSNCHGSVSPIKGSAILQNEYYTWLKHDKHSNAYSALMTNDARKMAEHLSIKDPARAPQCLTCHATYVADQDLRGERYTVEDGVSCESCHGAAQSWLAAHSESTATHAKNLANGLADTVSLENRAKLCLSCHYGDENKQVTHELYGAGHPRLKFELDTYSILQPKHWIVDADYKTRKADYIPIRAWLVGQVRGAESLLKILSNPHTKKESSTPELSLFDCFSCHHSLSQAQWRTRDYNGTPGRPKLNLAALKLLHAALLKVNPGLASELAQIVSRLNADYGRTDTTTLTTEGVELLHGKIQPLAISFTNSDDNLELILAGLTSLRDTERTVAYEFAEQIGMGIQAVLATSPRLASKHNKQLDQVFKILENGADKFDPKRFLAVLRFG